MSINMQRVKQIFSDLATLTSVENELTRLAFTEKILKRAFVCYNNLFWNRRKFSNF